MANNQRIRKHPGAKGRRPDHKEARRDLAIYNAKKRGNSDVRIAALYQPKGMGLS